MRFSKKLFTSTAVALSLASFALASSIDVKIDEIQSAPIGDRFKMMNELKLDIYGLKENEKLDNIKYFINGRAFNKAELNKDEASSKKDSQTSKIELLNEDGSSSIISKEELSEIEKTSERLDVSNTLSKKDIDKLRAKGVFFSDTEISEEELNNLFEKHQLLLDADFDKEEVDGIFSLDGGGFGKIDLSKEDMENIKEGSLISIDGDNGGDITQEAFDIIKKDLKGVMSKEDLKELESMIK